MAINAARTRIETAWRELNAKQQERDTLIAALEALGPGDEAAALELMSVESHRYVTTHVVAAADCTIDWA